MYKPWSWLSANYTFPRPYDHSSDEMSEEEVYACAVGLRLVEMQVQVLAAQPLEQGGVVEPQPEQEGMLGQRPEQA